ncbi:MAG: hypothetical protein AAGA54_21010 [Myxococcota bacterium]
MSAPLAQRRAAFLAGLLSLPTLAACGMGLPIEERIANTRPLAIRAEVDDPAATDEAPVRAEALPFETARMVPFIVDPEGALTLDEVETELQPRWLACNLAPIEGLGTCLANRAPLDLDDVPACPMVDFGSIDPSTGEFPEFPSPCEITTGTPSQPELTIPFDIAYLIGGDIEVTMVAHRPDAGNTDDCLEQLLQGGTQADERCLFVAQRLAVGPDAVLLDLAGQFGLEDIDEFGDIPETLPDADTNPRIQSFIVREFDEDDNEVAVFEPMRGEVITAQAGHRLDIETIAPEDDLQTFPIRTDDGFTDEEEAYEGLWFTTWGSLLSGSSDDPLSLNSWDLVRGEQDEEGVLPPGERATMYYVLRDGRQGVDWWWFHVDVTQ